MGGEFDALPDARALTLATAYLKFAGFAAEKNKPVTLRHWREEFYVFDGTIYRKADWENFVSDLTAFLNEQRIAKQGRSGAYVEPLNATGNVVTQTVDQLRAICQARVDTMPQWLQEHRPPPQNVIAFKNGWIDIAEYLQGKQGIQNPSTAYWFSENVIPYDFVPNVGCPMWITFLNDVFEGDAERVQLLKEWFGYCLTVDNRLQNILWLQGPPAAGKSVTTGILERMIGEKNSCNPTLSSLSEQFGLEPLLGKTAAIIGDAHLGRKDDPVGVLNIVKTITGGDRIDVNRKNLKALTGVRLPLRFTIGINTLPTMPDSSAAIRRRMLVLPFRKSNEGKEDRELGNKLAKEIPGIVQWALDGLRSLKIHERFRQPKIGEEVIHDMCRLSSPIRCFVEDCCDVGPGYSSATETLFNAFKEWAGKNGHGSWGKEKFGVELNALGLGIEKSRPREGDRRYNAYTGIALRLEVPT